jgi:hypothetical protein
VIEAGPEKERCHTFALKISDAIREARAAGPPPVG